MHSSNNLLENDHRSFRAGNTRFLFAHTMYHNKIVQNTVIDYILDYYSNEKIDEKFYKDKDEITALFEDCDYLVYIIFIPRREDKYHDKYSQSVLNYLTSVAVLKKKLSILLLWEGFDNEKQLLNHFHKHKELVLVLDICFLDMSIVQNRKARDTRKKIFENISFGYINFTNLLRLFEVSYVILVTHWSGKYKLPVRYLHLLYLILLIIILLLSFVLDEREESLYGILSMLIFCVIIFYRIEKIEWSKKQWEKNLKETKRVIEEKKLEEGTDTYKWLTEQHKYYKRHKDMMQYPEIRTLWEDFICENYDHLFNVGG